MIFFGDMQINSDFFVIYWFIGRYKVSDVSVSKYGAILRNSTLSYTEIGLLIK